MTRNSSIPPNSFEAILAWLNPDREVAGSVYEQLRQDLIRLFLWGQCSDPEGLTDDVFDRVSRKVDEVRPTYVGDPRHYFRAVAKNRLKEYQRALKNQVSIDDLNIAQRPAPGPDESVDADECLQLCLKDLAADRHKLVLSYYAKDKQAKIIHRNELATELGISPEALRVKVHRIRESLENCIIRCLRRKIQ